MAGTLLDPKNRENVLVLLLWRVRNDTFFFGTPWGRGHENFSVGLCASFCGLLSSTIGFWWGWGI